MRLNYLIVIAIILTVTLLIGVLLRTIAPSNNQVLFAICLGVLATVIPTMALRILESFLFRNSVDAQQLHRDISGLSSKISELKRLGIFRFSSRGQFDDRFWQEEMRRVAKTCTKDTKLVMVGRTLEKWIGNGFSELFSNAIITILRKGGSVRMITIDPKGSAGEMYRYVTGKDLSRQALAVEKFFVEKIKPHVTETQWRQLERKTMSEIQLTFTMFRSDTMVWISPYLSVADTSTNLAVAMTPESPLASAMIDDFDALWLHNAKTVEVAQ